MAIIRGSQISGSVVSASYALTASFALNGGGGGSSFPYTGSARITGSLVVTGSVRATAGFTGSLQGNADTATYASTAGEAAIAVAPLNNWIPGKPDVNNISPYSLGSPTSWWNSLYVGHGTIYFMSQSVGQPTTSASISIRDNTFVFNATDAQGNPSETVISGDGVSGYSIATGSVTASVNVAGDIFIIRSASYNPFTVSSTGLTTISGSAANLFLIKNASNQAVLTVSQSGVVILATSSVELTSTAPNGGIYFTSNALFIGLD
jgi:hypothetical protein